MNWFDLFNKEGESGFRYQDYSDVQVIEQAEVENFIQSGYKAKTKEQKTQYQKDIESGYKILKISGNLDESLLCTGREIDPTEATLKIGNWFTPYDRETEEKVDTVMVKLNNYDGYEIKDCDNDGYNDIAFTKEGVAEFRLYAANGNYRIYKIIIEI